ncbi:MAG: hypothetical protein JSS66_07195 [Armatimonadetes bacterium]|nr:hypothetical protein [Armatimonadota bacterium]
MKNASYFELNGSVLRIPAEGGVPRAFNAETGEWRPIVNIERFVIQAVDISEEEANGLMTERELAAV